MYQENERIEGLLKIIRQLTALVIFLLFILILLPVTIFYGDAILQTIKKEFYSKRKSLVPEKTEDINYWIPPPINSILDDSLRRQVEYGRELIAHTSRYLGPKGSVLQVTNGMNCQNCHLSAGTKIYGNNYSAVASTYPKFRARSGTQEDIYKRVNDCITRSLNGTALDTSSKEMQAIKAYITFVGSRVEKGTKPEGSGLKAIAYLDRAADPEKGKSVYDAKCASCHQAEGQGVLNMPGNEYIYPPLWGFHSYNVGAGLYRLSNFAKYVKYNMPFGTTHLTAQLTDEEAWDVAAFVNSKHHPAYNMEEDWPDISKKPADLPFGPFADTFSEKQHKYGPFQPIIEAQNNSSTISLK